MARAKELKATVRPPESTTHDLETSHTTRMKLIAVGLVLVVTGFLGVLDAVRRGDSWIAVAASVVVLEGLSGLVAGVLGLGLRSGVLLPAIVVVVVFVAGVLIFGAIPFPANIAAGVALILLVCVAFDTIRELLRRRRARRSASLSAARPR